jgi:hypothetical protein
MTWQISPGSMMLILSPVLYRFSCQAPRYDGGLEGTVGPVTS